MIPLAKNNLQNSFFPLDPNLQQFATERQWEILLAWEKLGTAEKAAIAVGINSRNVHAAKAKVVRAAALKNYIPSYGKVGIAPDGLTSNGISALRDADGEVIQAWDKLKPGGTPLDEALQPTDFMKMKRLSTMTTPDGVKVQWAQYAADMQARETLWRTFGETLASKIEPVQPVEIPRDWHTDELMACFPVGDHHMGMLAWDKETGEDYDVKIASRLLDDAVAHLIDGSRMCGTAFLVVLGDFVHYDGMNAVTPTSHNMLDSDTRPQKMIRMASESLIRTVDQLRAAYPKVRVVMEIGNHDLTSAIWMMNMLDLYYHDEPRVEVDISPKHFHYYKFGKCLIGTHHGHGPKLRELPGIMAFDCPVWWGETEHRVFWTGHYHNMERDAKDHVGCEVEQFRVLATQDAWATQKGYRSKRDMKCIVMHKEFGEIERRTVTPGMIQYGKAS